MRNKRAVMVFALLMAMAMLLTACGGSAPADTVYAASSAAPASARTTAAAAPAAPAAPAPQMEMAKVMDNGYIFSDTEVAEAEDSAGASALPADRKIVKHSTMELETKDFDTAFEQILAAVSRAGGYIESQNISGQSLRYNGDYYERYANINARVPAEKLDEVTGAIGGLCNVTSQWESIDDITDTYFDTDARLGSLELQEERLLDILAKAESLEDVITLEAKLSDVRYEIESLTARIRRMDSQVAFSYLNMTLNEVVEYQQVSAAPKTFGERISDAFARSGRRLTNFFENAVIFAIEDLPLMLIHIVIWLVVILVAVKVILKLSRRTVTGMAKGEKPRIGLWSKKKPADDVKPNDDGNNNSGK